LWFLFCFSRVVCLWTSHVLFVRARTISPWWLFLGLSACLHVAPQLRFVPFCSILKISSSFFLCLCRQPCGYGTACFW
jgi:hypothetical protein